MTDGFIAHVRKHDDETWAPSHLLSEHLNDTAKLAKVFSAKFNRSWTVIASISGNAGQRSIPHPQ